MSGGFVFGAGGCGEVSAVSFGVGVCIFGLEGGDGAGLSGGEQVMLTLMGLGM